MISVGFLGLGRIACGWDTPDGPGCRTHLKGCLAEPRLRPALLADAQPGRAAAVKATWRLDAEVVAPDDFFAAAPEIACVATPDDTHLAMLAAAAAAERPPRLLLVEKPLADDAVVAERLINRLAGRGCTVAAGFIRRWIPGVAEHLAGMRAGSYGAPLSAALHYTAGLRHNGAHGLDLIAAVLGETCAAAREIAPPVADRYAVDPSLSLLAQVGPQATPVTIRGLDSRIITHFEVDLLFERARLRIWDDNGIRAAFHAAATVDVSGYAPELRQAEAYHDDPPELMRLVWRDLADCAADGGAPKCDGRSALGGVRLLQALLASLESLR